MRLFPTANSRPVGARSASLAGGTDQCLPRAGRYAAPWKITGTFDDSVSPWESVALSLSILPGGIGALPDFWATVRSMISPFSVSTQMYLVCGLSISSLGTYMGLLFT